MGQPGQAERESAVGQDRRLAADGGGSLLDRILEGLSRPRARRVLYCLAEEEPRELDELAGAVAKLEAESQPTAEQRERVKIAIYHDVLPKLVDRQLVEYDPRSKTVCFRQSPPELDEFLQLCRRFDTLTA